MIPENNPEKFLPGYPPDSMSLRDLVSYMEIDIETKKLDIPKFLGSESFTIEITGIPEGPIPEEVRKEWVGVILKDAREIVEDVEVNMNIGDFKKEKVEKGTYYAVPITTALPALLEHSVSAARWWATRSPMYCWLFFEKEIAVVRNTK